MTAFEITRQTRRNVLNLLDSMSFEQMVKIPEGANNNILWNLGHIVVTQQALVYRLSGNTPKVDTEIVELFKKGSEPIEYSETLKDQLLDNFIEKIDITEQDYKSGMFQNFNEYPTSFGFNLTSIEEAIEFNAAHEALHLGYIMALRRIVQA